MLHLRKLVISVATVCRFYKDGANTCWLQDSSTYYTQQPSQVQHSSFKNVVQLSLIPLLLSIKFGLYLNSPTFSFFYRMQKCNIILIALTKKISLFFLSFLKRIVILIRQLVDTADSQIDPLSYDFVEWLLFDSSRSYHLEALLLFGICPLRPLYAH